MAGLLRAALRASRSGATAAGALRAGSAASLSEEARAVRGS